MNDLDEALPGPLLEFFARRARDHRIERLEGATVDERYVLGTLAGRGGFGAVYRAHDLRLDRTVALKLLATDSQAVASTGSTVRAAVDFVGEARTAASLVHPAIATVFDVSTVTSVVGVEGGAETFDGAPYIVSAWIEGRPLDQFVAPDDATKLELLTEIAEALAHAHALGVVHRDLKPSNVLVGTDARAHVVDFGLAFSQHRALGSTTAGTPGFMAPEQWRGRHQDARTDVFALGVLIYRLLTDAAPYPPLDPSDAPPPPRLRSLRPDTPLLLDELVHACLAPSIEQRPATALVVARTLRALRGRRARSADAATSDNPYPGLLPFREDEASAFFGRDAELTLAFERLARSRRRWLAVEGLSGVGKSSFVAAAVLPALKTGALDGLAAGASVATVRPGRDPGAAFAAALAERPTILVVDQLEELATQSESEASVRDAIDALRAHLDRSAWLVTTARSDASARLAEVPELARLANACAERFELGPLDAAGLERAITGPAALAGRSVPEETVARLVVESAAGASLPTIAYALHDLWQRSRGACDLGTYEAMGGVAGALTAAAERTLATLDERERAAARELLVGLVALDGSGDPARRAVERSDAMMMAGGGDLARRVLHTLEGGGGLALVITRDGTSLELVHERLCTDWPRLRAWVAHCRGSLVARAELEAAAAAWTSAGRPDDGLPRGRQLAYFEGADRPSKSGRAFLTAALAAQAAREAEVQRRRRWRTMAATLGAAAIGALVTWAVVEREHRTASAAHAREVEARATQVAARLVSDAAKRPRTSDLRVALAASGDELLAGIETQEAAALQLEAVLRRTKLALEHGDHDAARTLTLQAVDRARAALRARPGSVELVRGFAGIIDSAVWISTFEPATVRALVDEAITLLERTIEAAPQDATLRLTLVDQLRNSGRFEQRFGSSLAAKSAFERALAVALAMPADAPGRAEALHGLHGNLLNVWVLLGRPAEARFHGDAHAATLSRDDDLFGHRGWVWHLFSIGDIANLVGDDAEALALARRADEHARRVFALGDGLALYEGDLVAARVRRAEASRRVGLLDEAERFAHEALEVMRASSEPARLLPYEALALVTLGRVARERDDATATLGFLEAGAYAALRARRSRKSTFVADALTTYGEALRDFGLHEEALDWLIRAEAAARASAAEGPADPVYFERWTRSAGALAALCVLLGDRERAAELGGRVDAAWAGLVDAYPTNRQWSAAWQSWTDAFRAGST